MSTDTYIPIPSEEEFLAFIEKEQAQRRHTGIEVYESPPPAIHISLSVTPSADEVVNLVSTDAPTDLPAESYESAASGSPGDIALDLTVAESDRLAALEKLEPIEFEEFSFRLLQMYRVVGVSRIRSYVERLLAHTELPVATRCRLAYELLNDDAARFGRFLVDIAVGETPKWRTVNVGYRMEYIEGLFSHKVDESRDLPTLFMQNRENPDDRCWVLFAKLVRMAQDRESLREPLLESMHEFLQRSPIGFYHVQVLRSAVFAPGMLAASDMLRIAEEWDLPATELNVLPNLADLLLRAGFKKEGEAILDTIRDPNAKLYDDPENVHRVEIEQSVADLYAKLEDIDPPPADIAPVLRERFPEQVQLIDRVLERIENDNTVFKNAWMLTNALGLVGSYILSCDPQTCEEMCKVLLQEFADMDGLCTSAYLARLANAVSGFNGLRVGISWQSQIRESLHRALNELVQRSDNAAEQFLEIDMINREELSAIAQEHLALLIKKVHDEFADCLTEDDIDKYIASELGAYGIV